jgi:hypothetical protein
MPAVIGSWYQQSLNIWWFTAIGLAAAYYLIPKVIGRPVHSYNLASIGFWSFAVLGGLTGMVRLSGGPVPAWLVTLSIAATIMMIVPIATVTCQPGADHVRKILHGSSKSDGALHLLWGNRLRVGSVLNVISALRSVDQYLHFTPWMQGQQELLLYGFFSMVIFGAIYYITPRLVGCEWLSSTLIKLHFWGAAYGGGMFIFMLLLTGISMGGALRNPEGLFTQVIGSGIGIPFGPSDRLLSRDHRSRAICAALPSDASAHRATRWRAHAISDPRRTLTHEPFDSTYRRYLWIARSFIGAMVLIPHWQIGRLQAQVDRDEGKITDIYPVDDVKFGAQVYASEGVHPLSLAAGSRHTVWRGSTTRLGRAANRGARLYLRRASVSGLDALRPGSRERRSQDLAERSGE